MAKTDLFGGIKKQNLAPKKTVAKANNSEIKAELTEHDNPANENKQKEIPDIVKEVNEPVKSTVSEEKKEKVSEPPKVKVTNISLQDTPKKENIKKQITAAKELELENEIRAKAKTSTSKNEIVKEKINEYPNKPETKNTTHIKNSKSLIEVDGIPTISSAFNIQESKYAGKEITSSLLLSEELVEYLTFRAMELNMPLKSFFAQIMIYELENGEVKHDDLTKKYQKGQRDCIRKTIQFSEILKEDIKKASIRYHIKPLSFMAYCIEKYKEQDTEYNY